MVSQKKRTISFAGAMVLLPLIAILLSGSWGMCADKPLAAYQVRFEGVDDRGLKRDLESVSDAVAFKSKPPATLNHLERRARNDIPRLIEALKSQGFYDAEVRTSLDETADPVVVVFHVERGTVYRLKTIDIETEDENAATRKKLPSIRDLKIETGKPARAQSILDARDTITSLMRDRGFPFVKVAEPKVVVDHTTMEVSVTFSVDSGPAGQFGDTAITGLKSLDEKFVRRKLPWRKHDPFNAALFQELRKRLSETRLFSVVNISHDKQLDKDGLLPIKIELKERKHRTMSAGASYYSDEGPGVVFSWENRNLFNGGERLTFEVKVSGIGYEGKASYQKPAFLRDDQSFITEARMARDDTPAYVSDNTEFWAHVEREPVKGLTFGGGPGFRLAEIDPAASGWGNQEFALLTFPAYFKLDTSDNLLNPTRGGRFKIQISPYYDTLGTNISFLKGYAGYTHYFKVSEKPSIVLAGRAGLGMMGGAGRDALPADLRFYGGGGGSIRGYPYQTVGPLKGDTPLGGRSILELSSEVRVGITEKIGFVLFADGGNAYEPVYPDFSESLRWGTGAGIRYVTPFGPLRLDIAFPVNRREGIDDPFQVYVSIGQAY
jgi:translocation and assembly module TamA